MARELEAAEVDYVLSHARLELIDSLTWKRQGGSLKFAVDIANDIGLHLTLVGVWNPRTGGFSFNLFYPDAGWQRLRGFCSRTHHTNPGPVGHREIIRGRHKHTWNDIYGSGVAYVPEDITDPDPMPALRQFLGECHVQLNVDLPDMPPEPPQQLSLSGR